MGRQRDEQCTDDDITMRRVRQDDYLGGLFSIRRTMMMAELIRRDVA